MVLAVVSCFRSCKSDTNCLVLLHFEVSPYCVSPVAKPSAKPSSPAARVAVGRARSAPFKMVRREGIVKDVNVDNECVV